LEHLVQTAPMEMLALTEEQDLLVQLDLMEFEDHQELKDHQEHADHLDPKERMDHQEAQEEPELKEPKDPPVQEEVSVLTELLEQPDYPDLQVPLEFKDHLVQSELLEPEAKTDKLDQQVQQVLTDHEVSKGSVVSKDQLEPVA